MLPKIKDSELAVFEMLRNPVSAAEILFSDIGNLTAFDTEHFSEVRRYQYPFLSFDTLFYADKKLTKKENFEIKRGMAEGYAFGGRLTGKSRIAIMIDSLLALLNKTFDWGVISSLDAIHLRGVIEPMISALESHRVFSLLKAHILRSPSYRVATDNGCLLESVNQNIVGKNPGAQFFQKHIDRHWQEEGSFLTDEVSHKALMAQSENGCISRFSGMTTFSKQSPTGRIFYDLKNSNKITNLPSYVNPTWDAKKEEAALMEFGGRNSIGFLVQILGKVVEDCNAVYDIERIRDCYEKDKAVKTFDITRDNFYRFREIIILDRLKNADKVVIAMDVGEGAAPTEIAVFFLVNGIYRYIYNIVTNKLAIDEEYELNKYIIEQLKANYVGIDTTSGGGKALASKLTKDFPDNIIWVAFNEKIAVDFAKDESGNFIVDKLGNYTYKEEYITDWSIQTLKQLFYGNKIKVPLDYKFDNQFSHIVSMKSGLRTVYGSKTVNHLHQAFQVFAVVHWQTEFKNNMPAKPKKMSLGLFN
jgi:hypothetical protein